MTLRRAKFQDCSLLRPAAPTERGAGVAEVAVTLSTGFAGVPRMTARIPGFSFASGATAPSSLISVAASTVNFCSPLEIP